MKVINFNEPHPYTLDSSNGMFIPYETTLFQNMDGIVDIIQYEINECLIDIFNLEDA